MPATLNDPAQTRPDLFAGLHARLSADSTIRRNEDLSRRTTLRVGGPADLLVEPGNETDLAAAMKFCREFGVPSFFLGRGSNLLIRDGGFRGMVISLSHPAFGKIVVEKNRLVCGAGARLKAVANEARKNGLGGLEFLEGIPGSMGGALRMNAGAMGHAIFEVVESVRCLSFAGDLAELEPASLHPEYRQCAYLRSNLAVGAVLRGRSEARERIEELMNEGSRKRWSSQPAAPSAGCIFKNPPSIPSGKLIEELGLKGTRIGGAMVSDVHGNFIVNDKNATARDILDLIAFVQEKARTLRGIELQTEVEIVGEDLPP